MLSLYDKFFVSGFVSGITVVVSSLTISYMYNKRKQRYNKIEINTDLDEELLDNFAPLSAWKENMKMNLVKNGAHIEDVNIINGYKFGPRLGFVYMEAKVKYEDKYIPGVVLLRGPSCAVLMWYKKDNNIFTFYNYKLD